MPLSLRIAARRYAFSLDAPGWVTVDLLSDPSEMQRLDTYLVLTGAGLDRPLRNDDARDPNGYHYDSRIGPQLLPAGTYVAEATTYGIGDTGSYTLDVEVTATGLAATHAATVGAPDTISFDYWPADARVAVQAAAAEEFGLAVSTARRSGYGTATITFTPQLVGDHDIAVRIQSSDGTRQRLLDIELTADCPTTPMLPGTVAVSGGVFRGLVRNWSRHLWAYGVTVAAGEHVFEWPLSVQPGEVAPFEIAGWDGPADPDRIEFGVDADMSWHADPSRAFRDRFTIPLSMEVGESTVRRLPDAVRERYAHVTGDVAAGSVSVGQVEVISMTLGPAVSHLSLRGVPGAFEEFAVGDLRGYGAVFDSYGHVVDVGPAPAVVVAGLDGVGGIVQFEEATSLPHPELVRRHLSGLAADMDVLFDVHADLARDGYEFGDPDGEFAVDVRFDDEFVVIGDRRFPREGTLHGGFIVWVGAAHPERARG